MNQPLHRIPCPINPKFNFEHQGWPNKCPYRHIEYHWPGKLADHNTLIGDSIIKYVNGLNDTYVQAYPGANIQKIIGLMQQGYIDLAGYKIIIVHVGSNNLHSPNVNRMEIANLYNYLLKLIRRGNPSAAIVLSEIVPRTYENENQVNQRMDINRIIEQVVRIQDFRCYFFRSYRALTIKGSLHADEQYYAIDGLHLNMRGTSKLRASINGNIVTLKGKIWRKYVV